MVGYGRGMVEVRDRLDRVVGCVDRARGSGMEDIDLEGAHHMENGIGVVVRRRVRVEVALGCSHCIDLEEVRRRAEEEVLGCTDLVEDHHNSRWLTS